MSGVLAIVERKKAGLRGGSAEVISTGRVVADGLGVEVHVAACGTTPGSEALSGVGAWGADRAISIEGPGLEDSHGEAMATALVDVIGSGGYSAVLLGATAVGKDLAPRLGGKLRVPVLSDVTEVDVDGGAVKAVRPVYAGKAMARVGVDGAPQILTLRPNAFPASSWDRTAEVEVREAAQSARAARYRVKGFEASPGATVDVSEASMVVAGGRGMKGPEHWTLLEDLRDALGEGAALGASRAVVDAGWRPHGEQVGQTGKTVAPKLYFALGISGAIQHLAGMRTAQVIVAVNKDADAPIFGVADYGIVGDVFEVLPELTRQIQALRGS